MTASSLRWFARQASDGSFTDVFRTIWNRDFITTEKCWDNEKGGWVKTSQVSFSLLTGDNQIVAVEYTEIEHLLPEAAKPKDPWANY